MNFWWSYHLHLEDDHDKFFLDNGGRHAICSWFPKWRNIMTKVALWRRSLVSVYVDSTLNAYPLPAPYITRYNIIFWTDEDSMSLNDTLNISVRPLYSIHGYNTHQNDQFTAAQLCRIFIRNGGLYLENFDD